MCVRVRGFIYAQHVGVHGSMMHDHTFLYTYFRRACCCMSIDQAHSKYSLHCCFKQCLEGVPPSDDSVRTPRPSPHRKRGIMDTLGRGKIAQDWRDLRATTFPPPKVGWLRSSDKMIINPSRTDDTPHSAPVDITCQTRVLTNYSIYILDPGQIHGQSSNRKMYPVKYRHIYCKYCRTHNS